LDNETVAFGDAQTIVRPASCDAPRVLNNRYQLGAMLGEGGFGRVYRAIDQMLGREVAVKIFPSRADFVEEARTIAKLDHPNIVPVYDVGQDDTNGWIVMRLVDGTSLAGSLAAGPMSRAAGLAMLLQVAEALDAAHRRGVVHRDVKPQNILVEKDRVWVADFGMARILSGDHTPASGIIAGTPGYMSPEQVSGRRVDARTDVFSLGCVIHEVFTGVRAFSGSTFADLAYKVVHEQPPALSELQRIAGKDVEALARRALAKSPDDRMQTIHELLVGLRAAADGTSDRNLAQRVTKKRGEEDWNGVMTVETSGLRKGYAFGPPVIDDLTFSVPTGSVFGLLGRNGCGKTTVLRTILGIYRRDGGNVRVFGRDPQHQGPAVMARTGYVGESFLGYEETSVADYLAFMARCYANWDRTWCSTLLARFDLPLETRVQALSRGAQTKLSLIGALSHKPDLLVLDDPTLGLDAVVLDEFFETIGEVTKKFGTTVLLASHNLIEMESVVTHVGFMSGGRLLISDTLDALRLRTREVRMTFHDDPPDLANIPQFKPLRVSGRHVSGMVFDTSSRALERLKSLNPDEIEVRELSLREIFVNFLR